MQQSSKEPRAKPVFFSVEDVARFFDENPHKLVAYVEMGLSRQVSVLGVHIAQLANKVRQTLVSGTKTYTGLPRVFIIPSNFDNIRVILNTARTMFPAP